jgi:ABC-type glycerol-3-phosphate transport system substrate-binding protein
MFHSLALLTALLAPLGQTTTTLHVCLWEPADQATERGMQLLLSRYRGHHPQVTVAIMRYPSSQAHEWLGRWCKTEKSWRPDVVLVPDVWLTQVADQLEPPAAAILPRVKALASPALLERATAGGRLCAIPFALIPRLLFYWPDLLGEKNWQPGSWDQVLDATEKARHKSRVWGLGVPGLSDGLGMLFGEMLWASGGDFVGQRSSDALSAIDMMSRKAEDSLDVIVRCEREGIAEPQMLTWSQEELEDLFLARKLTAIVAPAGLEQGIAEADRAKLGVAPLPGRPIFTSLAVDNIAVFKPPAGDTSRLTAAQDFLAVAVSPEGQGCIAEVDGLPMDLELARKAVKSPALKAALLGMKNLRGLPQENSDLLVSAIERSVFLAVSGRMLSPRALEEGQAMLPVKLSE